MAACGGGGSGDEIVEDFFGAGTVRIVAAPRTLDTGDRTKVAIEINDVHPDGIILKVYYTEALGYVVDSSLLIVDGDELDIGPSFNGLDGDEGVFLVYFIPADDFGDDNKGTLSFELRAKSAVEDGEVSVDIDVDDPLISNDTEFDVNEPEYLAESETSITVQE